MPSLAEWGRAVERTAPLPINLAIAVALAVGATATHDAFGGSDPLGFLLISMSFGNGTLAVLVLAARVVPRPRQRDRQQR